MKDEFVWIGSDAWASRESVVENREEVVEGAIAVQPLRINLPEYDEYFRQLVENPNSRNPWFGEYLQRYHFKRHSSSKRNTNSRSNSVQYIHFVRDAVYAFAHALHDLHEDACGWEDSNRRLCPQFKSRVFTD